MHFAINDDEGDENDQQARRSVTDVSDQIAEYTSFLLKNPNQPKMHVPNNEMESLDYEPIDNTLTQSALLSKNMSVCKTLSFLL